MNKKTFIVFTSILLVLSANAGPKKRSFEEDYCREDITMKDASDAAVASLCRSFKKLEISSRKTEENKLLEKYNQLIAERSALDQQKEQAGYAYTPEIIEEERRLNIAFAFHEIAAHQLREEVHPAMDLKNKNWDNDPYWD